MKCNKLYKKLIFYSEGGLPENEMEKVKIHLLECQECAAFFEDMQLTLDVLEMEKKVELNPYFYTRVKAKIENSEPFIPTEESGISEGLKAIFSLFGVKYRLDLNSAIVRLVQNAAFSLLLLAGIYGGFKIGQPVNTQNTTQEFVFFLNELDNEPIESFLME